MVFILILSKLQDIRQLTRVVLNLSDFQLLCKATETEMLSAKEPLSVFFSSCGRLYEMASDQTQKQIADHLQSALMGFEKWVPMSETPPIIFRIHMVIGLIIFNCAPIVYVRVSLSQSYSNYQNFPFFFTTYQNFSLINNLFIPCHFSQSRHVSFL